MSTSNIVEFPKSSRQMSMREAFAASLMGEHAAYDLLDQDLAAVRVMVGYLNGASVAFRVLGDMEASEWCSDAVARLIEEPAHFRSHLTLVGTRLSAPSH